MPNANASDLNLSPRARRSWRPVGLSFDSFLTMVCSGPSQRPSSSATLCAVSLEVRFLFRFFFLSLLCLSTHFLSFLLCFCSRITIGIPQALLGPQSGSMADAHDLLGSVLL